MNYKYYGFTLAETLITLVIIGVIAAITVPSLITRYQKEQTVTRLKKAYSALAQTTARAVADNGPIETWELGDVNSAEDAKKFFNNYMAPYLSLLKAAKTLSEENWNDEFQHMNSNTVKHWGNAFVRVYLQDGVSLTSRIIYNSETRHEIIFYIDVNGDKKPNKWGKDIFEFAYFTKATDKIELHGKFLPTGTIHNRTQLLSNNNVMCNKNQIGSFCAALIMKDGWRIADDYPW